MNMVDGSNGGHDVERKENQIFVRNLAYSTTSEDLVALFEEFGPMKRATIVQKDGVSRGFGFVKFALDEHAPAAMTALQGRELNGRKMKLEIAVQRGQSTKGSGNEDDCEAPSAEAAAVSVPNTLNTSNSHLQLIVTGVPSHINKKVFRDAVVKAIPFKCKKLEVDLLKPEHSMFEQLCPDSLLPAGRVMLLTVPSRKDLPKLVDFLDGVTVKALGLTSTNASDPSSGKSTEVKCKLHSRPLKEVTPVDVRKQKCRLILRNLSFQAVEENVASRLSKFGPLVEVAIPRIEVDHSQLEGGASVFAKSRFIKKQKEREQRVQLRPRGFAFVTFLCEKDAAAAVSGSEGLKICNREFALDFCQHKYGYGFANENEEQEVEQGKDVEKENSNNNSESNDSDKDSDGEASSQSGSDHDSDSEEDEDDEDVASDYSGEEMQVDDEDDESEPGSEMEWDGSDSDSDADDKDTDSKPKKAGAKSTSTDVNEKKTVFVRDLAFDADQNDVKKVFKQFGPIEFAVIVLDKVTKNSKGSAFVKFQTQEAALRCVESCEQLPGANMAAPASKVNKSTGISASDALNNLTLTIKGRPFRVDLAVDRDEAKRLKDDTSAKSGKDKRNLYLANEGLLVDSAVSLKRYGDAQKANNDMSDADREKRRRSQNEKKKKLVNPLYFVSPTRLSVRNLKKTVNHSALFNLCFKAAKAGLENGLVEKKDMEEYLIAQSVPIRQRTPELLAIPKVTGVPQNKLILKAKVMLDTGKLRGADKAAQSRGYGFVEFKHHAHALACLRELNHNALYGKEFATQYGAKGDKKHNLIVDFSLENYQKVVVLNSRIEKRNLSQMIPSNDSQNPMNMSNDDDDEEVVALDRARYLAETAEVAADGESDDDAMEKKSKKSRYEKKLEHAQKRKAKELKRKENKKRKLEESDIPSSVDTTKKSKGADGSTSKATWGGFKRHRAKSKKGK